jgi:protein SCO1/2
MIRLLLASLCLSVGISSLQAADTAELRAGAFSPPRQAPELALTGSDGEELLLNRYRGKVVVLGFGFTSCPDVCPTTLAVLAQARKQLGVKGQDMQVVYVTVDPERDTPERMRKYLSTYDPAFMGATGSAERLATVRKQYGIAAQRKMYGKNYSVAHSSFTYLIDRAGRLRALMPYGSKADDYVHDVGILLAE